MIATARTCNLILIVLDCLKPLTHKKLIEHELEGERQGRAAGRAQGGSGSWLQPTSWLHPHTLGCVGCRLWHPTEQEAA